MPGGVVVIRPRLGAIFKAKLGVKHIHVRRLQVSLDAYFTITAHKSQGRTLNNVVHIVDTDLKNNIKKNNVYVPWSRVRQITQLHIVR